MKTLLLLAIGVSAGICHAAPLPADELPFHASDSLAARDEFGKMHQTSSLNPTDFEPRYGWRPLYYFRSSSDLELRPAYVGALQSALKRLGYYCGPIDGYYSSDVSGAIARMQKNYSMHVTGTLTVPVRRALFLP